MIGESESEMIQLSEHELDEVVGAGCHHGHHHGHHHRQHKNDRGIAHVLNQGSGSFAESGSHFYKRSLSITGQTITNADGSSVTSFSIQEEEISSSSFQILED
jgi:hypothetical protein